jgi:hypothetical protein
VVFRKRAANRDDPLLEVYVPNLERPHLALPQPGKRAQGYGQAQPPAGVREHGVDLVGGRRAGQLPAIPDGVFTAAKSAARADFRRLPTPDRMDLETLTVNVEMRVVGWLRRHGFLDNDPDEPPTEPVARSALDACLEGSLGLGELTVLPSRRCPIDDGHEAPPAPPRSQRRGGHVRGFDVHAGVVVSASDREGRERLLRYCARPPLSLERLTVLGDGRIAYAIRKPWGNETHRVMSPLQFLARLAALIPPPRHPLIRFYGVFAPHSSWRDFVYADQPLMKAGACINENVVAFYDGALHIVANRSDVLQSLLHEYTHHALFSAGLITPAWAQEGIAMNVAQERWWRDARYLQALVASPFSLERMDRTIAYKLPSEQALAFYVQSAAFVECLLQARKWALPDLLAALRAGAGSDSLTYDLLELDQSGFLLSCLQGGAR